MDLIEDCHPGREPDEVKMGLIVMERMRSLHAQISAALSDWADMTAADDGAKASRLADTLLRDITSALDAAYRQQRFGTLHPLEQEHWIPALEAVRQVLQKAAHTLSATPGARLHRAVEQLRRSASTFDSSKS
jgi:hypothetical protein